jgi:NADH:ubiquinone oxidoreductase subunit 5 (subunit L)/multisubunit Na+/H+ antiporter MnhA subunit
MFVAVGLGAPAVAIAHLTVHALLKALLFLAVGTAGHAIGSYQLDEMRLGRRLPTTAGAALVGALALAAVPPLGAARTKEAIVTAATHETVLLGGLVVLAGGLSALYAGRLWHLGFGRGDDHDRGRTLEHVPGRLEHTAALGLAAGSVLLGLLWLPPVERAAGALLGAELPASTPVEFVVSVVVVALGWAAAVRLVGRQRRTGALAGSASGLADWFWLPVIGRRVVADPVLALAGGAGRFDAAWDRATNRIGGGARALARTLARSDDRGVDGGVRAVIALTSGLSSFSARPGEAVIDGVVAAVATIARGGGHAARRLQTGLVHHYYLVIAAGLVAAALTATLGR